MDPVLVCPLGARGVPWVRTHATRPIVAAMGEPRKRQPCCMKREKLDEFLEGRGAVGGSLALRDGREADSSRLLLPVFVMFYALRARKEPGRGARILRDRADLHAGAAQRADGEASPRVPGHDEAHVPSKRS